MRHTLSRLLAGAALGLLVVALGGCTQRLSPLVPAGERPQLEQAVASAVASGAQSVDFAVIASFPWDRMFVFGPYTSRDRVERSLGHPWPGYAGTGLESSDMICLVVFQRDQQVVGWYAQGRDVDLDPLESRTQGYGRSESRFTVVRNGSAASLVPSTP